MITTGALIHGPRERLLAHTETEHPLAIQLGGNDPEALARCAQFAEAAGFDEVNLNVGCPSDRVQHAAIGACLMREPSRVADAVAAMRDAVSVPVTVKCRLGVDDQDNYPFLYDFATAIAPYIDALMVHARKAVLSGLSAAQNRSVPPLDYRRVHQLKEDFPVLPIVINGGITSIEDALAHFDGLDGVMIGRAAYQNPWFIAQVANEVFGAPLPGSPHEVLERFIPYIEAELAKGTRLHAITRHLHGLFNGQPGARRFRRHLSEHATARDAGIDVLLDAAGHASAERATRAA
jgi:tRNA-dihydrouridine synthase A